MIERSRRCSRRSTLALGASLLVGAASVAQLRGSAAHDATPETGSSADGVQLLFVQSFGASRLEPDPIESEQWILTLSDGTGHTLYFSDRPDRVAGNIPTDRFVTQFSKETADDPANAALVAQTDTGTEVTHALELRSLSYDAESGTATYTVRFLPDPTELQIAFEEPPLQTLNEPVAYGQSEVFIDAGGLMELVAYGEGSGGE